MDIDIKEQTSGMKFEKIRFLSFDFGQHIVRLLNTKVIYVHFLNSSKATVKCLDEECPYCKLNRQLILENPDDYKNQKGWNPKLRRHYFNVLDRTPVKVCPNCGVETKKGINGLYTQACGECGTFISGVSESPSNKIKVTNLSETNGVRLNAFQQSVLDEGGNHLGLENFDILFLVTRTAEGRKDITPVPLPGNKDILDHVQEDQLYDLDKAVIALNPNEMLDLQRGISLRDIFAARNPKPCVVIPEDDESKAQRKSKDEIKKRIDEMFA